MHLYLHIGTGRTGTQTLHDFLKRNNQELLSKGISYPILESKNHHNALALPICGKKLPRYLRNRYGDNTDKNLDAFNQYFDLLENYIKHHKSEKVILSSEFLGREFPENLGQILFQRLKKVFRNITILVYFRSPADYYLSATLQTLKASGILKNPTKQVAKKIIESYSSLGAEIVIKEYKRSNLVKNDICEDFISSIDKSLVGQFTLRGPDRNETLSAEVMSIIQDFRNEVFPKSHNIFNEETNQLLSVLLKVANENNLYVKPKLKPDLYDLLNSVDSDMRWLKENFKFQFTNIDYTKKSKEFDPTSITPKSVSEICVFDFKIKEKLMILGLSKLMDQHIKLNSKIKSIDVEKTKLKSSEPREPGSSKQNLEKQTQYSKEEIERIKGLSTKLRVPEFEVWGTPKHFKLFKKKKEIIIRNNFPKLKIDKINDWDLNPENNVVWRIYFNTLAWACVMLDADVEGNPYDPNWNELIRVVELFLDKVERDGLNDNSDIWDDHATGYRSSYLSYMYSKGFCDLVSDRMDSRVRKAMNLHREKLTAYLSSKKWQFSNHTLFQAEGLADLALVFISDSKEREKTILFAQSKVEEFIKRAVTQDEGTVKEHSLFYHVFLIGRLYETCEYFASIGFPIKSANELMFKKMYQFLLDVMPQTGRLPGIGDSKHFQTFDKKYLQSVEQLDSIKKLKKAYKSSLTKTPKHDYLIKYISDGYFILRSNHIIGQQLFTLFLHRSFRGPHGHWDAMSFVTYWKGNPVLIDSGGPYKYNTPMRYKYFQTQLAHNSLIYDNEPIALYSSVIDNWSSQNSALIALGSDFGKNRYWIRILGQFSNSSLIIVDIPVAKNKDHNIEIRYHLDPKINHHKNLDSLLLSESDKVNVFRKSIELNKDDQINLLSKIKFDSNKKISHKVNKEDREKLSLDLDFDKKSYVTYKDNELTEGKLIRYDINVNNINVTQFDFSNSGKERINVNLNSNKIYFQDENKELSEVIFDLNNLIFS